MPPGSASAAAVKRRFHAKVEVGKVAGGVQETARLSIADDHPLLQAPVPLGGGVRLPAVQILAVEERAEFARRLEFRLLCYFLRSSRRRRDGDGVQFLDLGLANLERAAGGLAESDLPFREGFGVIDEIGGFLAVDDDLDAVALDDVFQGEPIAGFDLGEGGLGNLSSFAAT